MRGLILCLSVGSMLSFSKYMEEPSRIVDCASDSSIDWSRVGFCYDSILMDRASTYYPSYEQCAKRDSLGNIDSSSNIYTTADGSFIDMEKLRKKELRWCALPKSMLKEFGGEPFSFGDSIPFYCESKPHINGKWVVHDVVSGKWGKTVDFLVHPQNNVSPKLGIPKDVLCLTNKKPYLP